MSKQFKYDVALSFANEDKAVADALSRALQSPLIKLNVFNYREKRVMQFGRSLMKRSQEVYAERSRHVIILVSKHYDTQGWASIEWKIIKDESRLRSYRYLWVIKIDESKLNGLDEDQVYEMWQNNAMELASLLKQVYDADLTESDEQETKVSQSEPVKRKKFRHFISQVAIGISVSLISALIIWGINNPRQIIQLDDDGPVFPPDNVVTLELTTTHDHRNNYIYVNDEKRQEILKGTEIIESLQLGDVVSIGTKGNLTKIKTINESHINQKTIKHELR